MLSEIEAFIVGDAASTWAAAGFTVTEGEIAVDGLRIVCAGDDAGPNRWRLRTDEPGAAMVDGIATTWSDRPAADAVSHPNRVVALDHVVLNSPDLDRTTDALTHLGWDLRRVRDIEIGGTAAQQRFFRTPQTIIELVGPAERGGDGPVTVWGFAFVVDDIVAATAHLGSACSSPRTAVQPGRRIATVRTRELGIGVTIALMTPHVGR